MDITLPLSILTLIVNPTDRAGCDHSPIIVNIIPKNGNKKVGGFRVKSVVDLKFTENPIIIRNLVPGAYRLGITCQGFGSKPSIRLIIPEDSTNVFVPVNLERAAILSGHLYDCSMGINLKRKLRLLLTETVNEENIISFETETDGTFFVPNIAEGEYRISCSRFELGKVIDPKTIVLGLGEEKQIQVNVVLGRSAFKSKEK